VLICAGALLESPEKIHRPGCLRIDRGTITEVGSALTPNSGEEILHLPEITLTPGWINLHAHLELASLHKRLTPGKDFANWLQQLLPQLPAITPEVRRQSILNSTQQAARSGTTSILSILSQRAALAGLTSTQTRVWWALEMIDLHERTSATELLDQATSWISRHPNAPWHLALSPHAPYSCSPSLFRELSLLSIQNHLPFTTHLAESKEESDLLAGLETPLRQLLPTDPQRPDLAEKNSPLSWCRKYDALPANPILAHGNEISPTDLPFLKEKNATIVHCPSSHEWFQRKPFSFFSFQSQQIPVVLGTDSPASSSNLGLDLRQEARLFQKAQPAVTPHQIWQMITTLPAQALGQQKTLGTLQSGRWADWVGWRVPLNQDPIPAILQSIGPAEVTCVGGKITQHEKI